MLVISECKFFCTARYIVLQPVMSQYAVFLGLARTIYIRCIYGIFGREIIKYTVIYGVYIRLWPTLMLCQYAVFSFSDRIYGTVRLRYGTVQNRTIRSKEKYSLKPNRTSTVDRILAFYKEREVLGSIPGQSCVLCFFTPFSFIVLFLLENASWFNIGEV